MSDLYLMKKVIILRKILKSFAPPFFNYLSLNLNRKKRGIMSHEKSWLAQMETLEKEVREIDCICCRQVHAMLIASAKILGCEGSISQAGFYRHLPDY